MKKLLVELTSSEYDRRRRNKIDLFWSKFEYRNRLNPLDGCWWWTGNIVEGGYGCFTLMGSVYQVHRLAYELVYSQFDCDLNVCHLCNVAWCGNPLHLYQATLAENLRYRYDSGRQARGTTNGRARLTTGEVSYIKEVIYKSPFEGRTRLYARLGDYFEVSENTVQAISTGQVWGYVKWSDGSKGGNPR